jgi:hypothetical protein
MTWHITVLSADGERLIFHAKCADRKECEALATEARGHSLALRILIRPPTGGVFSWD